MLVNNTGHRSRDTLPYRRRIRQDTRGRSPRSISVTCGASLAVTRCGRDENRGVSCLVEDLENAPLDRSATSSGSNPSVSAGFRPSDVSGVSKGGVFRTPARRGSERRGSRHIDGADRGGISSVNKDLTREGSLRDGKSRPSGRRRASPAGLAGGRDRVAARHQLRHSRSSRITRSARVFLFTSARCSICPTAGVTLSPTCRRGQADRTAAWRSSGRAMHQQLRRQAQRRGETFVHWSGAIAVASAENCRWRCSLVGLASLA